VKKILILLLAFLTMMTTVLAACSNPKTTVVIPQAEQESDSGEHGQTPAPQETTVDVTFVSEGKTYLVLPVKKGERVAEPVAPSKQDATFVGWLRGGEYFDFTTPIDEKTTLTAKFRLPYTAELTNVLGNFDKNGNDYVNATNLSMAVNMTDGFDQGTIEVSVTADRLSDNGIVFCVDAPGGSFDQGMGISYYFFFLGQNGTVYLGKTQNGVWTALKVHELGNAIVSGKAYKLKVVLSGTDVCCYVDDKLYVMFSETRFLQGTGYGIRSGNADAKFQGFRVSAETEY